MRDRATSGWNGYGPGFTLYGTTRDPAPWPGQPKGRQRDILWNGTVFPVTSSLPAEASAEATADMVARLMAGPAMELHRGPNERLVRHGDKLLVMHRVCQRGACGRPFFRWRFVGQSRRWGWLCSAGCRTEAKREADRARIAAKRKRSRAAKQGHANRRSHIAQAADQG